MAETQLNDNQLALNSETGSFAEMIFATQVGKEQIAQALTRKGTQTASTETLVQMAGKIDELNTNNSLMYGKGKNIFDTYLGNTISSVKGVAVLKNNYVLISTATTGYICDMSQEYDNWTTFLDSAVKTITWNTSSPNAYLDYVSVSDDNNTIVRSTNGSSSAAFEFYDLQWEDGVPSQISYIKTSGSSNKSLPSSGVDIKQSLYTRRIYVSNDRKLVAYLDNSNYIRLESYADDTIYARSSSTFDYSSVYHIDNGDVYCYKVQGQSYYSLQLRLYKFAVTESEGVITGISFTSYTDGTLSFDSNYSCLGGGNQYRAIYIKEQKALCLIGYKYSGLNLTASSSDKMVKYKFYALKLPTTDVVSGVVLSYDLGNRYKVYVRRTDTPATSLGSTFYLYEQIDARNLANYNYMAQFFANSSIDEVKLLGGLTFNVDFSTQTITETTQNVQNYAYRYISSESEVLLLFKQTSANSYHGLSSNTNERIMVLFDNSKEIITDIELNYNNTPICIYPLNVYKDDLNGLVQETLEVPVE